MLRLWSHRSGLGYVAACLLFALPAPLLAQRGPTGLVVTGTAASATINWQPVAGGVSYSVKRWKQDDLRCCNNASTSLAKPTWIDYGPSEAGFTQAGIYVFEVTVVMDDRTTAASVVNWTRPDAAPVIAPTISREAITLKTIPTLALAAPAGIKVRNDPSALVFAWLPVAGATGYQIDAAPAPEGPWTPLVAAPIAATQFAYTPAPGILSYYRVSAALSLAVSANGTIVPFIYNGPLNPLGVSATQAGANVTVSWNPVPGAIAYTVTTMGGASTANAQLQVQGSVTSATFVGLATGGNYLRFYVAAQFPPQGASGSDLAGGVGYGYLIVYSPSVCWPPAGELPGGSGQVLPAPVVDGAGLKLSWPISGQVSAYRLDRALASSGQWESLACLKAGSPADYYSASTGQVGSYNTFSTTKTEFRDQSIALQPSTNYQYRITALGPADASGKRATTESIVMAMTAPRLTLTVGATAGVLSTGSWVSLSWPLPTSGLVKDYLITSSFGLRQEYSRLTTPFRTASPRGTHRFSVTPIYRGGVSAATTTVTVVVP